MEAVVRPPEPEIVEPLLWLEAFERQGRAGRERSRVASLLLHAAAVVVLMMLPRQAVELQKPPEIRAHTALIAPPREFTQTAPNRGPVGKEFTLDNLMPRPRIPAPAVPPVTRAPRALGAIPAPKPRGPAALPEPPLVEPRGPALAQGPQLGTPAPLPPAPQIQQAEKPKLAFERPGQPSGFPRPGGLAPGRIPPPQSSVSEATRGAIRSGAGGLVVGDVDVPGSPGISGIPGIASPRSGSRSSLEMLSDPMGIDFKPYLIRVLAAVRRNWLAVIPESARLGRQGRVQIQFAIARDGNVPKLVIATPSGADALDRAAVAGISASNPFPPLPGEFQGGQIRLQFTFSYNMK